MSKEIKQPLVRQMASYNDDFGEPCRHRRTILRRSLDLNTRVRYHRLRELLLSVGVARPGGMVGFVGAPHGSGQVPIQRMFSKNIGLRGGLAPARAYLPELLNEVLEGRLNPSPILDLSVSLDEVAAGYAAMDQRRAMKVMVRP